VARGSNAPPGCIGSIREDFVSAESLGVGRAYLKAPNCCLACAASLEEAPPDGAGETVTVSADPPALEAVPVGELVDDSLAARAIPEVCSSTWRLSVFWELAFAPARESFSEGLELGLETPDVDASGCVGAEASVVGVVAEASPFGTTFVADFA